jgi:hypothetical protein
MRATQASQEGQASTAFMNLRQTGQIGIDNTTHEFSCNHILHSKGMVSAFDNNME